MRRLGGEASLDLPRLGCGHSESVPGFVAAGARTPPPRKLGRGARVVSVVSITPVTRDRLQSGKTAE
jgi:hypothetical protein